MAGSFAFNSSGTITAPAESAGPVVRIGALTAAANASPFATSRNEAGGTLKLSSTVSFAGNVRTENHTGTYTVKSNCTVTMELSADGGVTTVKYDGVFVNGKNQVLFVQNTAGTAVTGTLTEQ